MAKHSATSLGPERFISALADARAPIKVATATTSATVYARHQTTFRETLNSNDNHNGQQQKRHRTTFNQHQLSLLEDAFKHNSYPSSSFREALASSTNLDVARVQVWFQNRRAKHKRQLNQAIRCIAASRAVAAAAAAVGHQQQTASDRASNQLQPQMTNYHLDAWGALGAQSYFCGPALDTSSGTTVAPETGPAFSLSSEGCVADGMASSKQHQYNQLALFNLHSSGDQTNKAHPRGLIESPQTIAQLVSQHPQLNGQAIVSSQDPSSFLASPHSSKASPSKKQARHQNGGNGLEVEQSLDTFSGSTLNPDFQLRYTSTTATSGELQNQNQDGPREWPKFSNGEILSSFREPNYSQQTFPPLAMSNNGADGTVTGQESLQMKQDDQPLVEEADLCSPTEKEQYDGMNLIRFSGIKNAKVRRDFHSSLSHQHQQSANQISQSTTMGEKFSLAQQLLCSGEPNVESIGSLPKIVSSFGQLFD